MSPNKCSDSATERFRRGITHRCNIEMRKQLVQNFTESNTELEKFHETRVTQLEEQLRKKLVQCRWRCNSINTKYKALVERTQSLERELGRQTELMQTLTARLQQVTSAARLDLDNVQQKLDQFKGELSSGQGGDFCRHMQYVVNYLNNNCRNPATTVSEHTGQGHGRCQGEINYHNDGRGQGVRLPQLATGTHMRNITSLGVSLPPVRVHRRRTRPPCVRPPWADMGPP